MRYTTNDPEERFQETLQYILTCKKVTFPHLQPPHKNFCSRYFGLFRPCEMTSKRSLSFPLQNENSNGKLHNKAGHLDLTRCLGLLSWQCMEALCTPYTAALVPHLAGRAATANQVIPFPLLQGRAFHTTLPFICVPFSLSRGGRKCGTLHAGSSLPPDCLLFPCPGLCSSSLRKLSSVSFAFLRKKWIAELASDFIPQLVVSLPTLQVFNPSLSIKLPAGTAQPYV